MAEDDLRDRILDAAFDCLLESGVTARLHGAIAERAGVSRPTVYKYVGDQQAIGRALLDREVSTFLSSLARVLVRQTGPRERLIDAIAFAASYGINHKLLQKLFIEEPALSLPAFTTLARPTIQQVIDFTTPFAAAIIEEYELPPVDPRMVVEWGARIVISLITTPSPITNLGDPDELRRFVATLLDIGGVSE